MHILISDTNNIIPALKYGGAERVIWDLGKELSSLGHKVSYLVRKGSYCDFGTIIAYNPEKSINSQIPKDVDLVHFNNKVEKVDLPYVITMHGNDLQGNQDYDPNTIFISKNHAQRHGSSLYVYNGLDWNNYGEADVTQKRKYLHFLGKASWKVKNFEGATRIAVKSNEELHALGAEKWNFRNLKKAPFYKLHPRIKYYGLVDNRKKVEVMAKSKGLLFPVQWDEPFGLAIIESLYLGCPVYGSKRGSLPEIVAPEVGFLSNNEAELVEAIKEGQWSPIQCNEYVREKFNSKVMTQGYLELYQKKIATGALTS